MLVNRIREDFGIDAADDLADWLEDRKNRRLIRHRMGAVGYVFVPNDTAKDGRWKVGERRVAVYGLADIPLRDRLAAASRLVAEYRS